jgi:hypothetical protein
LGWLAAAGALQEPSEQEEHESLESPLGFAVEAHEARRMVKDAAARSRRDFINGRE